MRAPEREGPINLPLPEHRVYANLVKANGGPFDLALDFAYKAADEDPESLVRVTMSWEHVTVLINLLQLQVDNYEGQVGPLPRIALANQTTEEAT